MKHVICYVDRYEYTPFLLRSSFSIFVKAETAGGIEVISLSLRVRILRLWQ